MLTNIVDKGLQFELLWNDTDVFEVRISVWNGHFGGEARVYLPIGGLAEAAIKLDGFPRHSSDARELQFGTFGSEHAGGAVNMRFYCRDAAGHANVETRIESDFVGTRQAQSAFLFIAIEATAVDEFVAELQHLERNQRGFAYLRTL